MSDNFQALRVFEEGGKSVARVVELRLSDLDAAEVVIKTAFSSVNYKDALAVSGTGKVIRRFPCVAGIDSAGTVVESSDARFKPGDAVIATSYDLGVAHDGGLRRKLTGTDARQQLGAFRLAHRVVQRVVQRIVHRVAHLVTSPNAGRSHTRSLSSAR